MSHSHCLLHKHTLTCVYMHMRTSTPGGKAKSSEENASPIIHLTVHMHHFIKSYPACYMQTFPSRHAFVSRKSPVFVLSTLQLMQHFLSGHFRGISHICKCAKQLSLLSYGRLCAYFCPIGRSISTQVFDMQTNFIEVIKPRACSAGNYTSVM